MRLTLCAFGLTIIDLSILEPDPDMEVIEREATIPGSPNALTERSDADVYETARTRAHFGY